MRSKTRLRGATALVAVLAFAPSRVAAQAFTPPKGVGAVTLAWQFVDNTGHRLSDGTLMVRGQSVTTAAVFDLDYGLTDRLSTTIGIPYVFAKYTGAQPSFSGLPVDACSCWHSSFQDLSLSARYRLGDDTWALTPIAGYGRPSHDYPYAGEAVVGRNLQEARVGVNAVLKLVSFLPKASVHAGYTYSFVEKALQEIKNDRSNSFVEFGFAATRRLYFRGGGIWQRTYGGLRFGSPTGDPFFPPGELNTPERFAQRDRLIRSNYGHVGGGISYDAGPLDLFLSIEKYLSGTDTHNGQAYTVGSTWYFDLSK